MDAQQSQRIDSVIGLQRTSPPHKVCSAAVLHSEQSTELPPEQEDAHASGFELFERVEFVVAVPGDMRPDPVPAPVLSVLEDPEPLDMEPPELQQPCLPTAAPAAAAAEASWLSTASIAWSIIGDERSLS